MTESFSRSRCDLEAAGWKMVAQGQIGRILTPNAIDNRMHAIAEAYPQHVKDLSCVSDLMGARLDAGEHPEGVAFIVHTILDEMVSAPGN